MIRNILQSWQQPQLKALKALKAKVTQYCHPIETVSNTCGASPSVRVRNTRCPTIERRCDWEVGEDPCHNMSKLGELHTQQSKGWSRRQRRSLSWRVWPWQCCCRRSKVYWTFFSFVNRMPLLSQIGEELLAHLYLFILDRVVFPSFLQWKYCAWICLYSHASGFSLCCAQWLSDAAEITVIPSATAKGGAERSSYSPWHWQEMAASWTPWVTFCPSEIGGSGPRSGLSLVGSHCAFLLGAYLIGYPEPTEWKTNSQEMRRKRSTFWS